jgi:transposase-like protein
MCRFDEARFQNDTAAREYLEATVWPHGPVCPHCGTVNHAYPVSGRAGLYRCAEAECRMDFTVTVGTVFERSKIALHKWLLAAHLVCSSKKGMSSHQLHRTLGVTYKTAWFMSHRLREAMKAPGGMFSTGGNTVEADETYVGGKQGNKHRSKRLKNAQGGLGKEMVFSLVDRDSKKVRSFHLPSVNAANLRPVLESQIATAKTKFMTDGEGQYRILAPMFQSHDAVNHSGGEYVRGDAHTNTVEGFFSLLKRGIIGTFHHVSPQHLQRYTTEFDFRYNNRETRVKVDGKWVKAGLNDAERTTEMLKGIRGKRLTYRPVNGSQGAVTSERY